ncbi:ABATE domain-containing protein [Ferrovibrio sp.]|uniref:CGNR zinc finger domain-containing protein n=1 Tax=Ferrovibrio sp. TaxID=1917215 RepID=UPI002637DC4F|nr:ABATE domain-containing protein [Ferrovibrio sp.]
MKEPLRVLDLGLLGGHPALDFVNTLDWRSRRPADGGPEETLVSYDALLAWCRRTGIIGDATAAELARHAAKAPARAEAVRDEAVALREALHRLAEATRRGRMAPKADLAVLNHCLLQYPEGRTLAPSGHGGFAWRSHGDGIEPGSPLGAIARLAADLLVTAEPKSIRCCAGPGCGWLFHDTSPNKRRRWCSMEACGNRAKARRHYQRVKAAG